MVKVTEQFVFLGICVGLSIGVNASVISRAADPCAVIGGQKWVSPKAVRDCFTSIKVNETLKANVRTLFICLHIQLSTGRWI